MKKKTKRLVISSVLILIMIIASISIGAGVKDYYGTCKAEQLTDLQSYLENGKFREVELIQYEGYSKELEELGYERNFTEKVNGFYDLGGVIFINTKDRNNNQQLRALFHEYGHYVWFKVLSAKDRERYTQIYNSADVYVSYYALEGGVGEDFPETYEALKVKPEIVPNDRKQFFFDISEKYPASV